MLPSYLSLIAMMATLLSDPASAREVPAAEAHPCGEIVKICEKAGYTAAGHKPGAGMATDCFEPLLQGKPVKNVTVDAKLVTACQTLRKTRAK